MWWICSLHGNSQPRPLCERNTLQSCGQGCEQVEERKETHHPLTSEYTKPPTLLTLCINRTMYWIKNYVYSHYQELGLSHRYIKEKGATLSSNWSMKRSTPFTYIAWLSWLSMTPLGCPLVPLVYMMVHISFACGGQG